jgi:signal transduction histidine kinase
MPTRELSTPVRTHLRAPVRPAGESRPRAERHAIRSPVESIDDGQQWQSPGPTVDVRRLEQDLHDSVHTELVSLMLRLKLVEDDELTPPALTGTLAALGDQACAVLDSLREIIHGLQPVALSQHGIAAALEARADRSPISVTVTGAVPRSTDECERAVYFACSEAMQNAIKHAGASARLMLSLRHHHRTLTVRARDDGCGFDPNHPNAGTGLRNISDRIQAGGGRVELSSTPGIGTLVVISVPWPPRPVIRPARSS